MLRGGVNILYGPQGKYLDLRREGKTSSSVAGSLASYLSVNEEIDDESSMVNRVSKVSPANENKITRPHAMSRSRK